MIVVEGDVMDETELDALKAKWFHAGWVAAIKEAAANVRAGRSDFWDEQAADAGDEVRSAIAGMVVRDVV